MRVNHRVIVTLSCRQRVNTQKLNSFNKFEISDLSGHTWDTSHVQTRKCRNFARNILNFRTYPTLTLVIRLTNSFISRQSLQNSQTNKKYLIAKKMFEHFSLSLTTFTGVICETRSVTSSCRALLPSINSFTRSHVKIIIFSVFKLQNFMILFISYFTHE